MSAKKNQAVLANVEYEYDVEDTSVPDYVASVLDRMSVGQKVRIKDSARFFCGRMAYVAYVDTDGISVYLADNSIDECVKLVVGEWDTVN